MSANCGTSDESFDIVTVGSGAAGLTAALTAACYGLRVLVLEKSDSIGGTSAMSCGGLWVPANRYAVEKGLDSSEDAITYFRSTAPKGWGNTDSALWQAFVDHAPKMLDLVEENTRLKFELIYEPDPLAQYDGGNMFGRMLQPNFLPKSMLGHFPSPLRRSTLPHIFSYMELRHW